jgi:IclR family transcriptional regulator, pca regulon regulatory protein
MPNIENAVRDKTGSGAARGPEALDPAQEIQALSGDPNFMTSLARGLAVIRAFSQQKRRLSIAEVSHRTGIPRASVRRCLYTLSRMGYAISENGGGFSLRPKILTLGHAYLSSAPIATTAKPLLEQVSAIVHESCSLSLLEDNEVLYVARSATTDRIMSIDLGIGSRLPAYCSAMGRVLLAGLPPSELEDYLAQVTLTPLTNRTITNPEQLKTVLDDVRRAGHAVVDQELEIGLRSIAVPVKGLSGEIAAAMNVGTHASRASISEMKVRFLPHLATAAQQLSSQLSP